MSDHDLHTLVEVELVGGPFDGEKRMIKPAMFFAFLVKGDREHCYGPGDDGKYHYCSEIHEESDDE